jgi:hypothetical protein
MTMFRPDIPAKCCAYCGGRDHDYENCPKWKADAEQQKESASIQPQARHGGSTSPTKPQPEPSR